MVMRSTLGILNLVNAITVRLKGPKTQSLGLSKLKLVTKVIFVLLCCLCRISCSLCCSVLSQY